jgi:signal transduction histidine kinase/ActR/RegA family two-component response regulator
MRARLGLSRSWFPLLVCALGVVSTAAVALHIRRTGEAQQLERFEVAVAQVRNEIRERMETYISMLRAGAGLVAATDDLTAEEFHAFASRLALQEVYPGVQGIGFTARVDAAGLDALIAAQRRQQPDFRVWPDDARPEYHSILYLEPLDRRNRAALGYDMFTEPTRRAAMERARDSGSAAASGPVTLVQEIDERKQPGFLIYVPVYAGGSVPGTVAERRQLLRGFVYSPFRAGDLFSGILAGDLRPRVAFELFDGEPSAESFLHRAGVENSAARLTADLTIDIAGRTWTARMFSTAALERSSNAVLVPLAIGAGAAVTLILTGLAWLQTSARQRAEAVAAENARLYEQLQQLLASERDARAAAERVSRMKDEFLATLSHELRTPLNAVVGWAHLLSSGMLTDGTRQTAIDTILRNARIQSRLIEDLLDMSRIISGRVRIDMAMVNVREVIEAAVNVVRPTAAAKRIDLAVTAAPGLHLAKGDSNRLQQIVWNLLTNAVKFTPPGGRVEVRLGRRAEHLEISVSDTGIGIDAAFLPYVFERFRQADGSYTRGHGGLGLGLSIVQSLVEMHAGSIEATSDGPDRGATFVVRLPAASEADLITAGYQPPRQTGAPEGRVLEGLSILVVEDDADAGDLVREILVQRGAHVSVARSGAEALRLLHANGAPVELIVSDVGMPQMDGYEFIRRVRALPADMGGTAPAIALTAYAGAEDQTRAMTAGYDMHLAKPFTPGDLVAACTTLVRAGTV